MQKIIKPRSSSRQLLETVNFAFMKIFDFLLQNSHFWSISLSIERFASRLTAAIERWFLAVTRDANLSIEREMLQKWLY